MWRVKNNKLTLNVDLVMGNVINGPINWKEGRRGSLSLYVDIWVPILSWGNIVELKKEGDIVRMEWKGTKKHSSTSIKRYR